jgi:hypothetical protein
LEAATEHCPSGVDPEGVAEVKAARLKWEAATAGDADAQASPTRKAVQQRQGELADAKFLWKEDPAHPDGKAQVAALEELLDEAKRLDGRSPVEGLRAAEQALAALVKAHDAQEASVAASIEKMEIEREVHDRKVDTLDVMAEGLVAAREKVERHLIEVAKGVSVPAPPADSVHTQVQSLLFAVTAMQEGFARGTWADGGAAAMATVSDLSKQVQTAMPRGSGPATTAMPGEPTSPPGRRWQPPSGVGGNSAMEVDTSDAAAAVALQATEAAQAAAAAKTAAGKQEADADGFKTVGRDGKPLNV